MYMYVKVMVILCCVVVVILVLNNKTIFHSFPMMSLLLEVGMSHDMSHDSLTTIL